MGNVLGGVCCTSDPSCTLDPSRKKIKPNTQLLPNRGNEVSNEPYEILESGSIMKEQSSQLTFMLNDQPMMASPESDVVKLQNSSSLNISSHKLSLSPRSVIIDGDTDNDNIPDIPLPESRINLQTRTKEITSPENMTDTEQIHKNSQIPDDDIRIIPEPQRNLYRDQTERSWDVSDLEDLEEEMKMQMKSMSQLVTPSSVKTPQYGSSFDTDNEEYLQATSTMNLSPLEAERRGSNLVQTSSCDWDSNELEMEETHIKKQIKHLRSANDIDSNQ